MHCIGYLHNVYRAERVATMVLNQFINSRTQTLSQRGRTRSSTQLRDEQGDAQGFVDRNGGARGG